MAWRIHDSVQRGELDNRECGKIRGRVWLAGCAEPIILDLQGNACSDLAGCYLTFENPGPTFPLPRDGALAGLQRGTIGDLTASRKVRVPDVPIEEFLRLSKAGLPAPEHTANCLYLEWFSEANGRVVVESTEYKLTVSPPSWTLSPEQESERRQQAADAFSGFLSRLSQAIEATKAEPPEGKEWDEFDYEKLLRESDARTNKYMELLDKYEDHPQRERLVAEAMGWETDESELPGAPSAETDATSSADPDEAQSDLDLMNQTCQDALEHPLQPDPNTEGVDWVRTDHDGVAHPLAWRVSKSSIALWRRCEKLGLGESEDKDLRELLEEFQIAGAKVAGALNSLAYGRELREGPFVVACLKRALSHIHAAQGALERLAPRDLLPAKIQIHTRQELFQIREEILRLMAEFRQPND